MCDSGAIGPTFDQAKKKHNKRFGEFEFEYFGDSDVVNKLHDSEYFFVQEYILHFSSTFEISIKASEPT